MEPGMPGLGRMGANMAKRLIRGSHTVTGFDPNADARKVPQAKCGTIAASLDALIETLLTPRVLWLMVPGQGVRRAAARRSGILSARFDMTDPNTGG